MNRLSPNFTLDEFLRSETAVRHGIDMSVIPGGVVYSNLRRLCTHVLQPLRDALGPVYVLSGYRPDALNRLVGGSPTSQHINGLAADIVVRDRSPLDVARWIRSHLDTYDQVIHEFGQWTHVSVADAGARPRMHALTAAKVPGLIGKPKTIYVSGLLSIDETLRSA